MSKKNRCWLCEGKQHIHNDGCPFDDPTVFRGTCTCSRPVCPSCDGTGLRPQQGMKETK